MSTWLEEQFSVTATASTIPTQHRYKAVKLEGRDKELIIGVNDFVHLYSDDGPPYIARITALWEDPKDGEKKAQVLWMYRQSDVDTHLGKKIVSTPNEVFATEHEDENPLSTISEVIRIVFVNPETSKSFPSPLYQDKFHQGSSSVRPSYICSRFYKFHADPKPLTMEQFETFSGQRKKVVAVKSRPSSTGAQMTSASSVKPLVEKKFPYEAPNSTESKADQKKLNDAWVHALCCRQNPCPAYAECKYLVELSHHHYQTCEVSMCVSCISLGKLSYIHARNCTAPLGQCPVPDCERRKVSKIVEHTLGCAKCSDQLCRDMKDLLTHKHPSQDNYGNCQDCRRLSLYTTLHEVGCVNGCMFPSCPYYSGIIKHASAGNCSCRYCWFFYTTLLPIHEKFCKNANQCSFPHKSSMGFIASGVQGRTTTTSMTAEPTTRNVQTTSTTTSTSTKIPTVSIQQKDRFPKQYTPFNEPQKSRSIANIRIGNDYQASIPSYIGSRPPSTPVDEIIWAGSNSQEVNQKIEAKKKELLFKLLSLRGSVLPVQIQKGFRQHYLWVRVLSRSSEFVRVVPYDVAFPVDSSTPGNFLVTKSSFILQVRPDAFCLPENYEEEILINLNKQQPGEYVEIRGIDQDIARCTEKDFDDFAIALRNGILEDNIEMVERTQPLFHALRNRVGIKGQPMANCCICGTSGNSLLFCERFVFCGCCLCEKCFKLEETLNNTTNTQLELQPKKRQTENDSSAYRLAQKDDWFCWRCKSDSPPVKLVKPMKPDYSAGYDPDLAWKRRKTLNSLVTSSSEQLSSLQKASAKNAGSVDEVVNIMLEYRAKTVSADIALARLAEAIKNKAQFTLNLLESGSEALKNM